MLRLSAFAARWLLPLLAATLLSSCSEDPVDPGDPEACLEPDPIGCWRRFAQAPTRRQEIQPAELDGKIYLVGGLSGTSFGDAEVLSSVDVYDPTANSWTSVAPFPHSRHHVAVASANGKLYAVGGMTGRQPVDWQEQSSMHAYDPASDSWTEAAPMPTARGEHLAMTYGNLIFVIGGREHGSDSPVNEAYDPVNDTWSILAPMPTPRRSFAAAVLDSLIYIVGGRVESQVTGGLVNSDAVEAYSPTSDRWYIFKSLTTARGGLALGISNGKLYSMGGENLGGGSVYSATRMYDPSQNTWSLVRPIPVPVHGTGAVTIDGTIYLLAGATRVAVYSSDEAQGFVIR